MNYLGFLVGVVFIGFMNDGVSSAWAEGELFPGSKQVNTTKQDDHAYLVPLGRVKYDRAMGKNMPTQFKRVRGAYSAQVLKLSDSMTIIEARQRVSAQVTESGDEILFSCEKRDCGESFSWANDVFRQPTLYGNDRTQSLWVTYGSTSGEYRLYYLIQRPNKKTYFFEETVFIDNPVLKAGQSSILTADALNRALQHHGRVVMGAVSITDEVADYSAVVEAVGDVLASATFDLVLVLHRHGKNKDLASLEGVKSALSGAGIKAEQLEDVVNHAPSNDGTGPIWVEWVNLSWAPGQ